MPNFFSALKNFSKQAVANLPEVSSSWSIRLPSALYNVAHFSKQIVNAVSSRCVGKVILGAMTLTSQMVHAEAAPNVFDNSVRPDWSESPLHRFIVYAAFPLSVATLIVLCMRGSFREDHDENPVMQNNLRVANRPAHVPEIEPANFFQNRLDALQKRINKVKSKDARHELRERANHFGSRYQDPVTRSVFDVPTALPNGQTFGSSIKTWLQQRQSCPLTREFIPSTVPLRKTVLIEQWMDEDLKVLEEAVNQAPRRRR